MIVPMIRNSWKIKTSFLVSFVHLKVNGAIVVHVVDPEDILGQLRLVGAGVALLRRDFIISTETGFFMVYIASMVLS